MPSGSSRPRTFSMLKSSTNDTSDTRVEHGEAGYLGKDRQPTGVAGIGVAPGVASRPLD